MDGRRSAVDARLRRHERIAVLKDRRGARRFRCIRLLGGQVFKTGSGSSPFVRGEDAQRAGEG